jgi:ADP-L-glycero-D-manno-heptose 6-epimerase
MTNAIVTGSKGFIGKNLVNKLQKNTQYNVVEINEDIFNDDNWDNNLINILKKNKPNVIFHVGACSDTLEKDVNYMMKLNFESTKILTDYCVNNNSKIIYSSSAANYGENNKYPSNLYGWSKYVAEKYVISNKGVGLRYFNVYGPGEEHKGKMSSIAYQSFIKEKNGQECKLFPFNPTRDFVYVEDVIDANLYAEENYNNVKGYFYDVGFGESRSFEDILNIMNIPFTYHEEDKIPKGYQFYTCSDKKFWMKGWYPKYNLEKGLMEYKNYLLSINKWT